MHFFFQKTPKRSRMIKKILNVITFFFTLLNLLTVDTERYLETIFENSPGIYFEPIKNLKFAETKHHLVSSIKILYSYTIPFHKCTNQLF